MNVPRPSVDILGTPRILFAAAPLIVPMTLQLSALSLRAIVVLVVSRQKGITLVFKNDPLESVQVSSSFDGVESVAGYIQREIEGQLREAFRSDLPGIIHRLSQKWLSAEVKSKEGSKSTQPAGFSGEAKIETRTAYVDEFGKRLKGRGLTTRMSNLSVGPESVSLDSDYADTAGSHYGFQSPAPLRPRAPQLFRTVAEESQQSVAESIESYDPTYGLRPDSIPVHGGFGEYERLVKLGMSGRGLGDILGSSDGIERRYDEYREGDDYGESEEEEEERYHRDRCRYSFDPLDDSSVVSGLETIPAVGGGTITRPRTFHTQSQMRSSNDKPASTSNFDKPTITRGRNDSRRKEPSRSGSSTPRFPLGQGPSEYASDQGRSRQGSLPNMAQHRVNQQHRHTKSSSTLSMMSPREFNSSTTRHHPVLPSSYSSPPSSSIPLDVDVDEEEVRPLPPKRPDVIELLSRSPSSVLNTSFDEDLPITLDPARNDSCAHLTTLKHSNQTLSPFTRDHEHFTARSSPFVITRAGTARGGGGGGFASLGPSADASLPVKGKRKRIHRIGAAKIIPPLSARLLPPGTPIRRLSDQESPGDGLDGYCPSELSDYFPR